MTSSSGREENASVLQMGEITVWGGNVCQTGAVHTSNHSLPAAIWSLWNTLHLCVCPMFLSPAIPPSLSLSHFIHLSSSYPLRDLPSRPLPGPNPPSSSSSSSPSSSTSPRLFHHVFLFFLPLCINGPFFLSSSFSTPPMLSLPSSPFLCGLQAHIPPRWQAAAGEVWKPALSRLSDLPRWASCLTSKGNE